MTGTLRTPQVPHEHGLDGPALLDAYRTMRTIRDFEERLHEEFATGDIPGFVHLYAGEEASAAGVCAHLDDDRDVIASTHRGHGHCIAKHVDVKSMMAEIYGRTTGACHGKGGSNQGTTLESLNLASVWQLPAVFVAENNVYAEATSAKWPVKSVVDGKP
ncbi:thiamine pyrophosphate-dependent enzyme [Streptomyces sp. NPDC047525]|uniref:thiamine pyrophosphate-dependent enzyme n=1 Tax=Streptomyces sp. NPDC047525 TaxID=3155264 RepID=UPI0033CACAC9